MEIKNNKDSCLITESKEKASNLSASEYVKNGRQGDYLACDNEGKPICDLVGNLGKTLLKANVQKAGAVLARDGAGWNNWGMVGVRELKSSSPLKAFDIPTSVSKSNEMNRRVYSENGKAPTILTHSPPKITKDKFKGKIVEDPRDEQQPELLDQDFLDRNQHILDGLSWRKLTPLECERLQTVPDGYTEGVSKTQRYRMLGNGWTIDVIAHIFSYMKWEDNNE